jgi:hypothetical protein
MTQEKRELGEQIRADENGGGFVFSKLANIAFLSLARADNDDVLVTELRICDPTTLEARVALRRLKARKRTHFLRPLPTDGSDESARVIEIRNRLEERDNTEEKPRGDGSIVVTPKIAEAAVVLAEDLMESEAGLPNMVAQEVLKHCVQDYRSLVSDQR